MSTNRLMAKQNVVYTYKGVSFSYKKEGNSDTCYNMDGPWGHYAKCHKPVTNIQILNEFTWRKYTEESNSWEQKIKWLPWAEGEGKWRVII